MNNFIRLAIVLLFACSPVMSQTVISNVFVQSATASSATIVWTTNTASTSQVKYGFSSTSITYSNSQDFSLVTSHSMTLPLLNASQPYYFAVVSVDNSGIPTQSGTVEFSLCGSPTVPVSGTVNFAYGNGSYTLTFVPPAGSSGPYTVCGQSFAQTVTGTLNTSGSFSTIVSDALKVTPGPGTWTIAVNGAGSIGGISISAPLSAQTQDVTPQLQSAAIAVGLTPVTATSSVCNPSWVCSGTAGSVVSSPQFSLFYQPNPGSSGTAQGDPGITTDGAGHLTADTTTSKIRDKGGLVYDVKSYGATATGVVGNPTAGTDDAPFFRAAGAALIAAGGGTLHIPPGVYRITSNDPAATNDAIFLRSSHVHVQCDKGAVLYSTAKNLFNIGYAGPGYGDIGRQTRYPFNPINAAGATSFTETTASDASHFAVGDVVYMVGGPGQEAGGDAEINWVTSSDSSTGIVTLMRPTVKPFNTDGTGAYYIPGSPLNIAAANGTNYFYYDESVEGCEAWVGAGGDFIAQGQVIGMKITGNTVHQLPGATRGNFINHLYPAADIEISHNIYYGDPNSAGMSGLIGQPAYGVRDERITDNVFALNQEALNPSQGASDILISRNHFYIHTTALNRAVIVTSGAYGVRITDNEFVYRNDNAAPNGVIGMGLSNGSCIHCVITGNVIKATGNINVTINSTGSDLIIANNDITTEGDGINLAGRSTINYAISTIIGNKIHNVSATGVNWGITINGTRQVTIGLNNIWSDNLYTGVATRSAIAFLNAGAAGGTIANNILQNFKAAIITQTGDSPTISGNSCVNVTNTANCGFPGNTATATALASAPTKCLAGQASIGVDAAGNAQGCFIPSGGSGGVVAYLAQTTYSGTAGFALATVYTTPAAHQYRLCSYTNMTAVGTGGTFTPIFAYTNNGHLQNNRYLSSNLTTTSAWSDNIPNSGTSPSQCANFWSDASTVIQYGLYAVGVTGTPTVAYSWTLEQVQ